MSNINEKTQATLKLIQKLDEAEMAVECRDWLTPEEISKSLGIQPTCLKTPNPFRTTKLN